MGSSEPCEFNPTSAAVRFGEKRSSTLADHVVLSGGSGVMQTEVAGESVVELDIGVVPEAAVSGAVVLQDEYATYLTFNAMSKGADGKCHDRGTAIVTFKRCLLTKFGYPNDEALAGHPLYARGLQFYGVFEVLRSTWASTVVAQNRRSFPDTRDDYAGRHFIFTFHDSTFECLADELVVELSREPCAKIRASLLAAFR